jgi:hypothetical protein
MPKLVTEFNPNSTQNDHIETGSELVFPNIQSCVGVFGIDGSTLVGVHLTVGDKNKPETYDQVVQKFLAKCSGSMPSPIYAIGAVTNEWHGLLRRFGVPIKYFSTQPGKRLDPKKADKSFYIDLQVTLQSGTLRLGMQPASANPYKPATNFQAIDPSILHLL